ncbi:hypothetical protein H9P43_001967 [Blastocladiella emersonii ATCC 22665]|nr:hypothetical protein H9P43_001967 [Blastocladiella emersonii ATCC 22665]
MNKSNGIRPALGATATVPPARPATPTGQVHSASAPASRSARGGKSSTASAAGRPSVSAPASVALAAAPVSAHPSPAASPTTAAAAGADTKQIETVTVSDDDDELDDTDPTTFYLRHPNTLRSKAPRFTDAENAMITALVLGRAKDEKIQDVCREIANLPGSYRSYTAISNQWYSKLRAGVLPRGAGNMPPRATRTVQAPARSAVADAVSAAREAEEAEAARLKKEEAERRALDDAKRVVEEIADKAFAAKKAAKAASVTTPQKKAAAAAAVVSPPTTTSPAAPAPPARTRTVIDVSSDDDDDDDDEMVAATAMARSPRSIGEIMFLAAPLDCAPPRLVLSAPALNPSARGSSFAPSPSSSPAIASRVTVSAPASTDTGAELAQPIPSSSSPMIGSRATVSAPASTNADAEVAQPIPSSSPSLPSLTPERPTTSSTDSTERPRTGASASSTATGPAVGALPDFHSPLFTQDPRLLTGLPDSMLMDLDDFDLDVPTSPVRAPNSASVVPVLSDSSACPTEDDEEEAAEAVEAEVVVVPSSLVASGSVPASQGHSQRVSLELDDDELEVEARYGMQHATAPVPEPEPVPLPPPAPASRKRVRRGRTAVIPSSNGSDGDDEDLRAGVNASVEPQPKRQRIAVVAPDSQFDTAPPAPAPAPVPADRVSSEDASRDAWRSFKCKRCHMCGFSPHDTSRSDCGGCAECHDEERAECHRCSTRFLRCQDRYVCHGYGYCRGCPECRCQECYPCGASSCGEDEYHDELLQEHDEYLFADDRERCARGGTVSSPMEVDLDRSSADGVAAAHVAAESVEATHHHHHHPVDLDLDLDLDLEPPVGLHFSSSPEIQSAPRDSTSTTTAAVTAAPGWQLPRHAPPRPPPDLETTQYYAPADRPAPPRPPQVARVVVPVRGTSKVPPAQPAQPEQPDAPKPKNRRRRRGVQYVSSESESEYSPSASESGGERGPSTRSRAAAAAAAATSVQPPAPPSLSQFSPARPPPVPAPAAASEIDWATDPLASSVAPLDWLHAVSRISGHPRRTVRRLFASTSYHRGRTLAIAIGAATPDERARWVWTRDEDDLMRRSTDAARLAELMLAKGGDREAWTRQQALTMARERGWDTIEASSESESESEGSEEV